MANKEYVNLAGLTAYKSLWETKKNQIIEEGTSRVGDIDISALFKTEPKYIFISWHWIYYTNDFKKVTRIDNNLVGLSMYSIVKLNDAYYAIGTNSRDSLASSISDDLESWEVQEPSAAEGWQPGVSVFEDYMYTILDFHNDEKYRFARSEDGVFRTPSTSNVSIYGNSIRTMNFIQNGNRKYMVFALGSAYGGTYIEWIPLGGTKATQITEKLPYGTQLSFRMADNKVRFVDNYGRGVDVTLDAQGNFSYETITHKMNLIIDGVTYGYGDEGIYVNGTLVYTDMLAQAHAAIPCAEGGAFVFDKSRNIYKVSPSGVVTLQGETPFLPDPSDRGEGNSVYIINA